MKERGNGSWNRHSPTVLTLCPGDQSSMWWGYKDGLSQNQGRLVNKPLPLKSEERQQPSSGPRGWGPGANLSFPIRRLGSGAKEMATDNAVQKLKASDTVVVENEWRDVEGSTLPGLDLRGRSPGPGSSTAGGGAGDLPSGADPQLRRP